MLRIRTVLFPTDRAAWAGPALDQAHAFARAALLAHRHDATLHVLSVSTDVAHPPGVLLTGDALPPDGLRTHVAEASAVYPGLRVVEAALGALSTVGGILDYAGRVDADLVVMATHGRRGLDHLLLGSVAEAVVREAACPVLTVGPTARLDEGRPLRILAPVDFSVYARLALAHAKELARLYEAELHVLHVVPPEPVYGWVDVPLLTEEGATELGMALRAFAHDAGGPEVPVVVHTAEGPPAEEIAAAAERLDAGLLVIATHGRRGLRRVALGSVAERVVQRAPCPVLTVKAFGKSLLHLQEEQELAAVGA